MSATKIMIIRHAEKPGAAGAPFGVDADGNRDPEELTVRGWQRAGALVRFLSPVAGQFSDQRLAKPNKIFASGVGRHSKSKRPSHTVTPLAAFLGQTVDLGHVKGEEDSVVQAAIAASGAVLICWEHEAIPALANKIIGTAANSPQQWPGDRFDIVWVLNRPAGASWSFHQVPQLLLSGDSLTVISSS